MPTQDANLPKPENPIPEDTRVRRRLRPEERRPEILDAALAVFSDLGFQRATLQDVADRAGVTKGALYHYFASKEQLFIELMRERMLPHVEEDEAMLAVASGSRDEILRALMLRLWEHFRQPGQIELTLLAITELPQIPRSVASSSRRSCSAAAGPWRGPWLGGSSGARSVTATSRQWPRRSPP